jgi:hypothetical protein
MSHINRNTFKKLYRSFERNIWTDLLWKQLVQKF